MPVLLRGNCSVVVMKVILTLTKVIAATSDLEAILIENALIPFHFHHPFFSFPSGVIAAVSLRSLLNLSEHLT